MLKKEDLIILLRNAGVKDQAINRILNKKIKTLLTIGKAENIEKIFKILDEHEIKKETMENCLSVLAYGKAENIEKIFKILDEYEIKKENVEENYGISFYLRKAEELEEAFLNKPETNILLYIKLKGYCNRIISQEEINEICNYKKLSNREFFMSIGLENFGDILLKTLDKKGYIYIGQSREMTKEQMEKYSEIILNISKNVSKNVGYQYKEKDISELESLATSVIIEKCGDIVYNAEINLEIMSRCIYNKCKKYLIGSILLKKELLKKEKLNFDKISNIKLAIDNKQETEVYNVGNSLDLQQWDLTEQQEEILGTLSSFIENGYNYEEALNDVADAIGIDLEELMYEMEEIKLSIKEKGREKSK